MKKTNLNQDDLFGGAGNDLVEYTPSVVPPFADMDVEFFSDRLMYIHNMVLDPNQSLPAQNFATATKQIELLMRAKGLLNNSKVEINSGQVSIQPAEISFVGVKPSAGD